MKKLFPTMLDKPDNRAVNFGFAYGIVCFFVLPFILGFSTMRTRGQSYEIWLEMGYHLLNFLLLLIFFLPYLRDSFLLVQVRTKIILKTALFGGMVVALYKICLPYISAYFGNITLADTAFGSYITNESDLLFYSTAVIAEEPIWGTLCMSLLTPFTVSCLFYGTIFAPACVSRPWLAYLLIAFTQLLIRLTLAFCLWPFQEEMMIYLIHLPVHLLACWSYQKTDTIWTPIFLHMTANLILAPFTLAYIGIL